MPARKAHILQIVMLAARTHALLAGRGPRILPLLRAQKKVFELVHARVGKQQGRIVGRHQRGRVHTTVPLRLKEVQKQLAYLISRAKLHSF